jgi:putative transport protein
VAARIGYAEWPGNATDLTTVSLAILLGGLIGLPAITLGRVELGLSLFVGTVPHVVTLLVGKYVLKLHPGILIGVCCGAGTSAPALAAVQEIAASRIPALGYGVGCALGNVVLALWGGIIVLLLAG